MAVLAGALERLGLGMRPAAGLGPAAADDHAVLDDDRADRRIGPGAAEPAAAERQRKLHEALIERGAGTASVVAGAAASLIFALRRRLWLGAASARPRRSIRRAPARSPSARGNCDRPRRSAHRRRRRASRRCSITISPMVSEVISLSPSFRARARSSTPSARPAPARPGACAARSDSERISLSRSNGTRRPLRLMTTSSRNCTRSKVVKRKLQVRQTRRRRIAAESSVGRESFTWVSRTPQLGQRIRPPQRRLDRRTRSTDRSGSAASSAFTFSRTAASAAASASDALGRQRIEHLDDQLADLAELGDAEAARGAGRRAEPDAGRDRRLLRIERDAVLVAGDVGAAERHLGDLAGQLLRPQVDQHQVRVGAAGDDVEPLGLQRFGQRLGVLDDVLGVDLERRAAAPRRTPPPWRR